MLKFEVARGLRSLVVGVSHPRGSDRWELREIERVVLRRLEAFASPSGAIRVEFVATAAGGRDLALTASADGRQMRVVIDFARLASDVTPEGINAALARVGSCVREKERT